MQFPRVNRNQDQSYGPTKEPRSSHYIPTPYHNPSSKKRQHKSQWVLKEYEQFGVFKIADERIWYCEKNRGLMFIQDNGNFRLGKNNEVLAIFLQQDKTKFWHGYPTVSNRNQPSEKLLKRWENEGIISPATHRRLVKWQL